MAGTELRGEVNNGEEGQSQSGWMRRKKGVDQSQYTSIYVGVLRIYVSNTCHTLHMHRFSYSTCRPHIPATAAMIPIRDAGDARRVRSQVFRIISIRNRRAPGQTKFPSMMVATKPEYSVLTVKSSLSWPTDGFQL
jgi:hypothetical protein